MTAAVDHLPYRLLGASGRTRLQQRLEAAVRRWLEVWVGKDSAQPIVRLGAAPRAADASREPFAEAYRIRSGDAVVLDVRVAPGALGAVVGAPLERFSARAAASRMGGLSARFASALLRGLVNELMDSASIADWKLEEIAKRAEHPPARAGSQTAVVLRGERELATLDLSPLLVNALVPPAAAQASARYAPCRGAIRDGRVRLEAVLGEVELSVPDFMSLDRGDVIVLNARLGDSCRVEIPEVAALGEATVGKSGRQRAIRIRRTDVGRA